MKASAMMQRQQSGQGSVAIRRCRCGREVLSAYRGAVTAVGQGVLEKVEPNGDVIGRCGDCGGRVVWAREVPRPR